MSHLVWAQEAFNVEYEKIAKEDLDFIRNFGDFWENYLRLIRSLNQCSQFGDFSLIRWTSTILMVQSIVLEIVRS